MNKLNDFLKLYCYDNNEDLILKLCKKFKLEPPKVQANYYGDVDVIFCSKLKIHCVQVLENKIVLKRRKNRNIGQKTTKAYMNTIKEYYVVF